MTIIALIPILVAVLGAIVYLVAANEKLADLGRCAFLAGCIAACLVFAGTSVRIG